MIKSSRFAAGVVVAILTLALPALALHFAVPKERPQAAAASASASPISTVFLIVLENVSWGDVSGSSSAPYLNSLLGRPDVAYATNYNTPPGLHPSTPNYIWMEAGSNLGITDNSPPSVHHQPTHDHLVTYLRRSGHTWRAYFQNRAIDGEHCPMGDSYPYPDVPFMLPFAFFDDVTGARNPDDAYCASHIQSEASLELDLTTNMVADYNFIRVGDCKNMHDSCPLIHDRIRQGDDWLATAVPAILESAAYNRGAAVFVTWDEGTADTDGPLGMIVLSRYVRRGGYHNALYYTHSSLLKTIQEIFSAGPLLGDAGSAQTNDLSDLFSPGTIRTLTPRIQPS